MKNDPSVGNRILFDGFSAMGYNSAGNNISISGDEISTVTNPRFDVSAEIACLTLSAHPDSTDKGWIQCTQGVFFESNSDTTIEANKNIVSAKTIRAGQGLNVGGTVANPSFKVETDDNTQSTNQTSDTYTRLTHRRSVG